MPPTSLGLGNRYRLLLLLQLLPLLLLLLLLLPLILQLKVPALLQPPDSLVQW